MSLYRKSRPNSGGFSYNEQMLTQDETLSVMSKPKPNQQEVIKIKVDSVDKYLKGYKTPKEREQFLIKACDYYSRYLQRQKDRGAR